MSANPAPDPAQALAARIASLQSRLNELQSAALLASIQDELGALDTRVNQMSAQLQAARAAGYVFGVDLEPQVAALQAQWPGLRSTAQAELASQAPPLQMALRVVEGQFNQLNLNRGNLAAAQGQASQVETALASLEAKVKAAHDALAGIYSRFQTEAGAVQARLDQVKQLLGWLAEASFQLLPTEGVYAAVAAKWDREGKDDPKGLLFLTDQRVLFEQKEEIATKKVLFVTTAKEKVQRLLLEVPVAQVESATASKRGLLGHEDHLDAAFSAEAPVRAAHFHLDGQDCHLWETLLGRAKARDLDKERAVQVDQAVLTKLAQAPTQCSNCGAAFTHPVLRGQTEIKCEFCGSITRF